MSRVRSRAGPALRLVALFLTSACGGDLAPLKTANKGAGDSDPPPGGSPGGGVVNGISPPAEGDAAPPGAPASDPVQQGSGACVDKSLEQVIAAVHQGWPDLADIKEIYGNDPNRLGDGSFIYAFANDTGFALAFKRGGGDCPAGCTENEYWYFLMDAACVPTQIGHYSAGWATGNCLMASGKPMWGIPHPPDPATVCGADNTPAQVNGVYNLRGTGTRLACTEKAGGEPQVSVNLSLTLSVSQEAGDLSRGTVTVQGTGHPLIDGQPIPATFTRRRFTASLQVSNLPAVCLDEHSIQIHHDFESGLPGRLEFFEARSLNCPPFQTYCKGAINLDLATTAP
jgi:hypothetical protein